MTLTQTEIVGFVRNLLELLTEASAELTAAGVDVGKFQAILTEELENAVAANARQEALKRELREATVATEESHAKLYRDGSSYLDASMGAIGKTTRSAKNFQRLRSRVRVPGEQSEGTTPVEPSPAQ